MDDILTVDPEGMITIPDVGRVPVAGLPIDAKEPLEQAIKSKLNAAGVVDVEMYIRPMDTQPVSIFVTGFVPRPGNYTGTPSDTILAFLDKAGGIDSKRGSYRNIRVLRQGQEVGSFDLYPFALKGAMPHIRFQDGDTVVVGEKGPSVITSGEVRNTARFEFKPGELTGAKLIELADPQPRATHVSLSGSRGGAPYNLYLPMNDFKALRLENGDQIRFLADRPGDTIMVEAQGAIRGASRFPVRRNTRLHEVMSYIAVEPGRANLEGLYIKRKSVAVRQKKAIEDALRRLEQNAYTATSASSDEAQIRSKEAEMLSNFISRAKEVQPEGVVVVGTKGNIADLALEDGDVIVLNKPKGLVVHPAPGHADGTLVNALLHHCGDSLSGIGGEKRPGIVHRIDRDTSGLIIAAKNDFAHQKLSAQLSDHSLARTYECIVIGNLREDSGTVDAPIGRDRRDRKKMAVVPDGRRAVTHWEVIARYPGFTHVRCRLETGRTHQIRVHMAYLGHPILGDTVYFFFFKQKTAYEITV